MRHRPVGRNYLRVRGEYPAQLEGQHLRGELPPRARRIQKPKDEHYKPEGTTSACAENTNPIASIISEARNYLRVRGEYPK